MKQFPRIQCLSTGILLALAGGVLNAYTYLWRGEVLATSETGNIVLMGLEFAKGNWSKAVSYILPISAFALGVFMAEVIRCKMEQRGTCPQWRKFVLWLEVAIVVVVALLPLGTGDGVANIAISFVSAIQVESFRTFCGCQAFTTMCTGNIRSGVDNLSGWLLFRDSSARDRALLYGLIILAFFGGVLACALLSNVMGQYAGIVAVVPLIIVYFSIRGECEITF